MKNIFHGCEEKYPCIDLNLLIDAMAVNSLFGYVFR